ncbi:MAG TPA: type II toxin-antitoxin system VapC family toxin, partial [Burkholderiales bacterium]|nr:type II toxin-antitoxin system VapC family toxin [Burkholderiales bacterium]
MIVLDASALLELLLGTARAETISRRALASDVRLHAPHLVDVEILQALRGLVHLKELAAERAEQALGDLSKLVIERHSHADLGARIWALRGSLTAYDGAYVALAEALGAPLLTC